LRGVRGVFILPGGFVKINNARNKKQDTRHKKDPMSLGREKGKGERAKRKLVDLNKSPLQGGSRGVFILPGGFVKIKYRKKHDTRYKTQERSYESG